MQPLKDKVPGKNVCRKDHNAQSSQSVRCKNNCKLREWWVALSDERRAQWYRDQQEAHVNNTKRSFDMVFFILF